jgi:hypothetical protein
MGQFNWIEVKKRLVDDFSDISIAVETGTLFGDSTAKIAQHFKEVHTIELNEQLHLNAADRFAGTSVNVHFGNSSDVLARLVPLLQAPTIFYLDAHWSGDTKTDWGRSSWKGYHKGTIDTAFVGNEPTSEAQVPLAEELKIIVSKFQHKCIIYIDDMDKFGGPSRLGLKDKSFVGEDWSHLSVALLKEIVEPRLLSWDEVSVGKEQQLFIKMHAKN